MTNEQPHFTASARYDDEIDLMELFTILWRGKYIILITVVVCAALGAWKVFTDQEWWVATAKVEAPRYNSYQKLQSYVNDTWPENPGKILSEIGYGSVNEIFRKFIEEYQSVDNKRRFILESGRKLQSTLPLPNFDLDSDLNDRLLASWLSNVKASSGRDETAYTVEFPGGTDAESLALLRGYVAYINQRLSKDFFNSLQEWVSSSHQLYSRRLDTILHQSAAQLNIEIARLEHSLTIARAAGVNNPITDPGVAGMFAINLGVPALSAKLDALRSIEDLSIMNPEIKTLQLAIQQLDVVSFDGEDVFGMVHYLESPTLPLSRSSPKRVLILIATMLIGGVIGVIIVFVRHAIHSHNLKSV